MHEKLPTKTVRDDGWVEWKLDGKLHRLDGPAEQFPDGFETWYRNGLKHRLDGPAIRYAYGRSEWYCNDHPPSIVHISPNLWLFQDTFPIQDYPSLVKQDDGSYTVDKEDLALIMLKYNKDIWTP